MTAQPDLWLLPDAIFDGTRLRQGAALGISGGQSLQIADTPPPGAPIRRLTGTLTPGFLDLQVNGGGDALLNNDQSPQALHRMAAAHRRFGTVGILPTVITDAPEVLARAVDAVLAAHAEPQPDRSLLGLHIEGPHLSIPRRGTHAPEYIRPFDASTLAHVRRLRDKGLFVKITVAPESTTPQDVARLAGLGAVVSIGHSDATADEVLTLLDAGATSFTHLFNAMSPMLNRAPGVTGACINSTAYAGIICDGIHVADEMVGLAIRARPVPGRMFLVSDAMSTVGGSDHLRLYGRDVWLKDGRLVNAEGSLAGAHVTMAEGLHRLITVVGTPPEVALDMATAAPARLLNRPDLATPEQRDAADLLLLAPDWTVTGTVADALEAQPA
ncbi:N-acetylglucosamine-6-phosphate deacetylase [Tabrizicola sp.]|uniref:N-acetylglucosamine-6-phosphate deacetylase n=1 Tax=Tabrizicola sp. TaxID=2005166 RepID=UPI0035ADDEC6